MDVIFSEFGYLFENFGTFKKAEPNAVQHDFEKRFRCERCPALKRHERSHDAVGERPTFECPTCKRKFQNASILKTHKRTHAVEKPFQCGTCGKRFPRRYHLKSHERTHTGEKSYPCAACKQRFSRCDLLQAHLRLHTGETPYLCVFCGELFRAHTTLRHHEVRHLEENKLDQNRISEKEITTPPDSPQLHDVLPSPEREYHCPICGEHSRTSGDMSLHERRHASEKVLHWPTLGVGMTQDGDTERPDTTEGKCLCSCCGIILATFDDLTCHECTCC